MTRSRLCLPTIAFIFCAGWTGIYSPTCSLFVSSAMSQEKGATGDPKAPANPKEPTAKKAPAAKPSPGKQSNSGKSANSGQDATEGPESKKDKNGVELATFGGGCFWCTEAVFLQLKGVQTVTSGYSGGKIRNPTYQQVSTGLTGHAEVIQVAFDPSIVNYETLLEIFWKTHDPTTLNRQGPDIGPQYRSVIFVHNDRQLQLATQIRNQLNAVGAFGRPVVTEITRFTEFFPAEKKHQNYFELNRKDAYCKQYIVPKLDKFKKVFKDYLKTSPATDKPAKS